MKKELNISYESAIDSHLARYRLTSRSNFMRRAQGSLHIVMKKSKMQNQKLLK